MLTRAAQHSEERSCDAFPALQSSGCGSRRIFESPKLMGRMGQDHPSVNSGSFPPEQVVKFRGEPGEFRFQNDRFSTNCTVGCFTVCGCLWTLDFGRCPWVRRGKFSRPLSPSHQKRISQFKKLGPEKLAPSYTILRAFATLPLLVLVPVLALSG
jgi:hypothetical protein